LISLNIILSILRHYKRLGFVTALYVFGFDQWAVH
jgi:hypothetical protein